jgi:AcrR family transcriptional regulator
MNQKDEPRQRLIEAAGEVFAAKGFKGATIREIIRRAETNIAAVNYYFRDKERLYIEAVKSACQTPSEKTPFPVWPPGTPATVKLRDFIHTMVRRMLDKDTPAWHQQLFLREMAQPSAACAELVQNVIRPIAELLMTILRELVPEVEEVKRHLIAFSIVGQCFHHRVARPVIALLVGPEEYSTYDTKLLADHITQFSLAALGLELPAGLGATPAELASAVPSDRGEA